MNLVSMIFLLNMWPISAISIILDILKFKNIENCFIFNCYNNYNIVSIQKVFNDNNIKVSSFTSDTRPKQTGYSKIGFILDASCEFWNTTFGLIDETYFRRSYTWLIKTDNLVSTASILSKFPFEINSDVILITKSAEPNLFYLHEAYNQGFYTKGSFLVTKIGLWDSKLYLNQKKRTNLTGVVLKCVVVVIDPIINQTFEHYLENTRPEDSKVDSLHKLKFFTLIKYLGSIFNFSYELRRTNSWGYLRNGSFDGMVGTLQRREADIGGTPIFYRSDRAQFIDYITSTWQSRPCFILRHPKYPGGFSTIYTRPLTDIVWYCIIATLTAIGVTLGVMLKLKVLRQPGDNQDSSTSMAFIFIFSAVSQQGSTLNRGSLSIKIIIFITFILSLTLYQYYNATVVSTLLREPPKSIRSLKDLMNSNLEVGVEDVLYNKDYFKRTTDPLALKLYHRKIVTRSHSNFFTPDEGMALVKRGGFAFHVDSVTGYKIMRSSFSERQICDAHEIQLYPPQTMAAALTKHSPYREHVAIGIRKIYEAGLMHRLKSIWDEPKPPCVHTPDTSIFNVTLREFSSALILLGFGVALAVIILMAEIAIYEYNKRY
ncbi:ionotropic receptor 75a-like isoform X1 [Maniola jurtina]|uniref:ionotropic receptor 75a-like isoform X1 n=2 Tax=Maniola jurtina TaxID=191418 RepID=UPI001E688EE5|nr:ionotropic receptor 75a-like isoform X1 [Maniola jurtina]